MYDLFFHDSYIMFFKLLESIKNRNDESKDTDAVSTDDFIVETSNFSLGYDYYNYDYDSDDTRIVNGYDPLDRPWMVLITIGISPGTSLCGGALLNHL